MKYNDRLVNSYSESELLAVLNNPDEYKRLVLARLNRKTKDSKTSDLALIDAVDNYIIKMITTKPQNLNKNAVMAYRDLLYNVYRSHPHMALDSILFKKGNIDLLFSQEQIKHISDYKRKTTRDVNLELNELLKKPNQTASEDLLRFAEVQIGVESDRVKNFVDNLYRYLLNNQSSNTNFYAREFILKYTAYNTAKKLDIPPVCVYMSNYGLDGKELTPTNRGSSYGNSSIININRDYALDKLSTDQELPNYVKLLHTITHEVKHSHQAYHAENGLPTIDAFIYIRRTLFRKHVKYTNGNEYNINYLHNEIENDSNYFGWLETEKIIKKYVPSLSSTLRRVVSNSIVTAFQTSTATKVIEENNKRRRIAKDKFNVDNMDSIVKANPGILNTYPLLKKIYHSNGERRSFVERLQIEYSSTGDERRNLEKIYSEFDAIDFRYGAVEDIDVSKLDINTQFHFFDKIFSMALSEGKQIKEGFKVFGLYSDQEQLRSSEFMKVSVYRSRRLAKYVDYINSNKDLILHLDAINKNGSSYIYQTFMIRLRYVADELKSVKKYISDFKEKYSNDAEKAKMLSELSTLEQSEVFINGIGK